MNNCISRNIVISFATATILLTGCGGGGSNDTTSSSTKTAYLIDSAVEGVDYTCGSINGSTLTDGSFKYKDDCNVTFTLGNIEIGTIQPSVINSDGKVLPNDIVGVSRDDINNTNVLKILTLLQSLDHDGNPDTGIKIESTVKETLKSAQAQKITDSNFNMTDIVQTKAGKTIKEEAKVKEHFSSTLLNLGEIGFQADPRAKMFGEWLRVDTGAKVNIITTTSTNNFKLVDDDLIQVTLPDESFYYLVRTSISKTELTGKIEALLSNSKSISRTISRDYSGIGGIDVILKNVLDNKISATVKTKDDGTFENNDLPSGKYQLEASLNGVNLKTEVTLEKNKEDIGEFKIIDDSKPNFQPELIMEDEFLYADDNEYEGIVRVHNIGKALGSGLSFEITSEDSSIDAINKDNVMGSIKPSEYLDIPVKFKFNNIAENSKNVTFNVKITSADSTEWYKDFNLNLYKTSFNLNIGTKSSRVKGYIVLPQTNESKQISINNGYITLPTLSTDSYTLVLSNSDFDEETAYSIGVGINTDSFTSFNQSNAHEPNNKIEEASNLNFGEKTISYLHAGDIDFWTIKTPENDLLLSAKKITFEPKSDQMLNNKVKSNAINVDFIKEGSTTTVSIDENGSIVKNSTVIEGKTTEVAYGDTLAIELKTASVISSSVESKLIIGDNFAEKVFRATTKSSIASDFPTLSDVVEPYSDAESESITIENAIGDPIKISTDDGDLIINGENVGDSGEIQNGDTVALLVTNDNDAGSKTYKLTVGGQELKYTVNTGIMYAANPYYGEDPIPYGYIKSPITDKIWLDRNIGATQVCTSTSDNRCFGDYFQWGRQADGHEKYNSATIARSANNGTTNPSDPTGGEFSEFIKTPFTSGADWLINFDSSGIERENFWRDSSGENYNICPVGFRVPTRAELEAENMLVKNTNYMNHFLKLPYAGARSGADGSYDSSGVYGYLWTTDRNSESTSYRLYYSTNAYNLPQMDLKARNNGYPIRCIQD